MSKELLARIREDVTRWAETTHRSSDIYVGIAAEDDVEYDEATRYLVDYAIRQVGYWLVAEVWVADGQIVVINDMGEGLPLENVDWPWPDDD